MAVKSNPKWQENLSNKCALNLRVFQLAMEMTLRPAPSTKIRNTVIARVFRELHLIEQWGTGVQRIFAEAKALGLPEPQLIETGMRVRLIIRLLGPIFVSRTINPLTKQLDRRPELKLEARLNSALAAKVIFKLQEEDNGKLALAQHLGHKTVSGELKKQIRRLLDLNLIEMTLPDKPNSRLQKYRLTVIGQALIDVNSQGEGVF